MRTDSQTRRTWTVSFSGMDGAGKSTQINALRRRMEGAGMAVALVPFWDEVATLTSLRESTGHVVFKGDKGVGSPEAPVNRRDKNVRSPLMTGFRFFLYLLDAISLRRVARKAQQSGFDLVIFDRYAYDELANLNLRNPVVRAYARLVMKIVPRPDISFLLDADPAQARARKPEYPLEFLFECRASYRNLSDLLGGITIIPPMPVEQVQHEIMKNALEKLSVDSLPSAPFANSSEGADAGAPASAIYQR